MYVYKFETIDFSDNYRFLLLFYNAVWIIVSLALQLYELSQLKRINKILFNLFKAFGFNILILAAVLFSLKAVCCTNLCIHLHMVHCLMYQ